MKLQLVPLFQSCTSNLSVINIWPPYQNNSVVNMHFLGYSVSDSIKMKRHLLNKKIFLQKILFLTGWKTLASLVPIYRLITESKEMERVVEFQSLNLQENTEVLSVIGIASLKSLLNRAFRNMIYLCKSCKKDL